MAAAPAEGDAAVDSAAEVGSEASTEQATRIDNIDMSSGAAQPTDQMVIVTMGAGDPATEQERADAIRRELAEQGIARDQIYIEGKTQ